MRSRLNDIEGGEVSITFCKVSPLWRTILYKTEYCSRRVVVPNHLSSQNLISNPFRMEKEPNGKKMLFSCHNASPKVRISRFPYNLRYCFRAHIFFPQKLLPSSILSNYFSSKALWTSGWCKTRKKNWWNMQFSSWGETKLILGNFSLNQNWNPLKLAKEKQMNQSFL